MNNLVLFSMLAISGALGASESTFIRAKFCFPQKEIPKNIQISFNEGIAKFSNSTNETVTILADIPGEIKFPKTLLPNQMPVAVYTHGERYEMSKDAFKPKVGLGNALSKDFDDIYGNPMPFCWFCYSKMDQVVNQANLTPDQLRSYYEVPFNYYVGDKYVTNRLRIFFTGIKRIVVARIVPILPFPEGFRISFSDETRMDKNIAYTLLTFGYSAGNPPLTFVKDFKEPFIDQALMLKNKFPFMVIERDRCFRSNPETYNVVSRKSGKQLYDNYFQRESAKAQKLWGKNTYQLNRKRELLKKDELYQLIPLGYVYPGNGRVEHNCELELKSLQAHFFKTTDILLQFFSDEVHMPKDEVAVFDLTKGKKLFKLHFIKRYYVEDVHEKVRLKFPRSKWHEKDLVCGATPSS